MDNKPFNAISLTGNVKVMTAFTNDQGYEQMSIDQLKVRIRDVDALVAISASWNSPNGITAVEYAKSRGAALVGLTGFDGGKPAGAIRYFTACSYHYGRMWACRRSSHDF